MTYSVSSGEIWMIQDLADEQLFSFEVNEDPSLIGEYTLDLLVSSVDYPADITPKIISLPVSVRCTGPQLFETWTAPAVWEPTEYDQTWTSNLPTYISCHLPYTDMSY